MLPALVKGSAWKGVFAGFLAFPALVASAAWRIVGKESRADALADWVWRNWLGLHVRGQAAPRVAVIAVSVVAFVVTLYLLVGIGINLGYPLRADAKPTDWGGPSLGRRWAVHAAGGLLFALATPLISKVLAALARRFEG